jgi:hypothetical protein
MDSRKRHFNAENGANRPAMRLLTLRDDFTWEDTTLLIGRVVRQILAACAAANRGAVRCN